MQRDANYFIGGIDLINYGGAGGGGAKATVQLVRHNAEGSAMTFLDIDTLLVHRRCPHWSPIWFFRSQLPKLQQPVTNTTAYQCKHARFERCLKYAWLVAWSWRPVLSMHTAVFRRALVTRRTSNPRDACAHKKAGGPHCKNTSKARKD